MTRRVLAIAGAAVADAVRRKVFYVLILFALAMVIVIPTLPSYGVGVVKEVYREVALALEFVVSFVLAIALSANRIPGDVERRTIYNVLSKKVERREYVLGAWLGIAAALAAALVCFTVIAQVVGFAVYRDVMWRLWQGSFAIWLEMGVLAAFSIAFSAFSGPVAAATASIAFVFVGHSRDALVGSPGSLAYRLYPSLDAFNVINPVAHGTGISPAYAASMIAVFVGYAGIMLLIAVLAFSRKDL